MWGKGLAAQISVEWEGGSSGNMEEEKYPWGPLGGEGRGRRGTDFSIITCYALKKKHVFV